MLMNNERLETMKTDVWLIHEELQLGKDMEAMLKNTTIYLEKYKDKVWRKIAYVKNSKGSPASCRIHPKQHGSEIGDTAAKKNRDETNIDDNAD